MDFLFSCVFKNIFEQCRVAGHGSEINPLRFHFVPFDLRRFDELRGPAIYQNGAMTATRQKDDGVARAQFPIHLDMRDINPIFIQTRQDFMAARIIAHARHASGFQTQARKSHGCVGGASARIKQYVIQINFSAHGEARIKAGRRAGIFALLKPRALNKNIARGRANG